MSAFVLIIADIMLLLIMSLIKRLRDSGFSFNKNLGQNFIADESFLAGLVERANIAADAVVVEIGTGAGTLTRVLACNAKRVVSFEIDKRLEPILKEQFAEFNNIELIFADAMKIKDDEIIKHAGGEFIVVANIPYYITTPLLMKFIGIPQCHSICMLVQDDVARRIVAEPGGKEYGALSVTMQAYAKCEIIKYVPRGLFTPVPNVDSAFIKCEMHSGKIAINDNNVFEKMLKGMFAARRKTVLNGLSIAFKLDKETARSFLAQANINEGARAETVSPQKFIELSNLLADLITTKKQ